MPICFQTIGWDYCRQWNTQEFHLWVRSMTSRTADYSWLFQRQDYSFIQCFVFAFLILSTSIPIIIDLLTWQWPDSQIYHENEENGKRPYTQTTENSQSCLGGLPNGGFIQVAHTLVAKEKWTALFLHNLLRCLAGPELQGFLWPSLTGSCGIQTGLTQSRAVREKHGWEGSWSDSTPN